MRLMCGWHLNRVAKPSWKCNTVTAILRIQKNWQPGKRMLGFGKEENVHFHLSCSCLFSNSTKATNDFDLIETLRLF